MTRIVIVGAGIAGISAAYAMKEMLGCEGEVCVIADRDYFHFVPSNPWIAMGWRDRDDIAFPIAPYLEQRGIEFICIALSRVLADKNQIVLGDDSRVDYDYLILATGPKPLYDSISGLGPDDGYTQSVVHIEEALRAHVAYREFIRKPGPVVIGAAQNASILGPVYECAFLIDSDLRRRNVRDRVPVTIVTPEPYIGHLGIGGEGETHRILEQALQQHDIHYLCNAKTQFVEPGAVHVMACDAAGNDKQTHVLPFSYSIYWPEFHGVDALRSSAGLTDERGFVLVDQYMRSPPYNNIYAVGMCVKRANVEPTSLGIGAPESVYSIQKEVGIVTKNILATLLDATLTSATPARVHWLNDMGKTGAIYLSEPQIPLRNINWLKQGRWVHRAKVDFEHYIINRIKLNPSASGASNVQSHIARVICQMEDARNNGAKVSALARALPKPLEVPVQRELCMELRALAKVLDRAPSAVAAELLDAAVHDARSYLSDALIADVERARRKILIAELPENQPGIEFDSGGT